MKTPRKPFMTDIGVVTRTQKTTFLEKALKDLRKSIVDYRNAYEKALKDKYTIEKEKKTLEKENAILRTKNDNLLVALMQSERELWDLPSKYE